MFKFQTTTYINGSTYAFDSNVKRYESLASGSTYELPDGTTKEWTGTPQFIVRKNNVVIKSSDVVQNADGEKIIYKKVGCVGVPDSVEINVSNFNDSETTYRLALYIRLSMASQDSYYANDFVFKGKPFYVEFKGGTTAEDLAKLIKKYELLVIEKPILKVTVDGDTLKITATNNYQRLKKVVVEKWTEGAFDITPGVTGGFEVDTDLTSEVQVGHEEFGTYYQLTKDNVLPTYENRRWVANQIDEAPIPGALYNQYLVNICVKRGIMGGDAVGEVTKSVTTHVFWVKDSEVSAFEEALLAGTEGTLVEVDTHTGEVSDVIGEVDSARNSTETDPAHQTAESTTDSSSEETNP